MGKPRKVKNSLKLIFLKLRVPFKERDILIFSFSHTLNRKDQRQSVLGGGEGREGLYCKGTNAETGTTFWLAVLSQWLVELFLRCMTH